MNMILKTIKNTAAAILCAVVLIPLSSCVKDNFTIPSPGANVDPPDMHATMTIKQFKQQYYVPILSSALPVLIPDSVVLCGIINADDRSGNFYKTISLQDSTGGLQIKINGTNLFYNYPVGRRIWIKTKGLYIFNYGGTLELGGYIDLSGTYPSVGGIAGSNAPFSIVTGKWGLPVPIDTVTIQDLNFANYVDKQSMLYEILDAEFASYDTSSNVTYADALTKASVNLALNDCTGASITLRSSGYANFATQKPASGHGSIRGIYTYYSYTSSNNAQFVIRDTTDIHFTSTQRCH
jgi:hypothetical protein